MTRGRMVIMKGSLADPFYTEVEVYKEDIQAGREPFDTLSVGYYHDELLGTWSSWEQSTAMRIGGGFKTRKSVIDYTHDVAPRVLGEFKKAGDNYKHILNQAKAQFNAWCVGQVKGSV